MGGRTRFRRTKDPPRPTKGDEAGAVAERDPHGSDSGVYALSLAHFVIRSLMFEAAATVDLRPAIVHGMFSDPEMPAARVPRPDTRELESGTKESSGKYKESVRSHAITGSIRE